MFLPIANLADAALVFAVLVFTWIGFRQGFAESVWSMLRWVLILAGGALSWAPFGEVFHARIGLPKLLGAFVAYAFVAFAIVWLVRALQRFFSPFLLKAIPAGRLDGGLGLCSGLVTGLAVALVFLALVNPIGAHDIDWNPSDSDHANALSSLLRGVGGALHRVAIQESALGRLARQELPGLLLGEGSETYGLLR